MAKKPVHHSENEGKKADILVNILLDRSGSMSSLTGDVIGHYNTYVQSLKEQNARVSLVIFDTEYQEVYLDQPAENIEPLTRAIYYARGSTALLDALGRLITSVDAIKNKPDKIVFVVNTDGYENASHEFTKKQIKELVTERQNNHDWQFVFIGAGIDAFGESASLGVRRYAAMTVTNDSAGYNDAYAALDFATRSYTSGATLGMVLTNEDHPVTDVVEKKKKKRGKIESTR